MSYSRQARREDRRQAWRYELVELLRFRVMMLEGKDLQTCPRCQDLEEELLEREQQIAELRAELRKYEPSDGVMFKLRSLEDALAASEAFSDRLSEQHAEEMVKLSIAEAQARKSIEDLEQRIDKAVTWLVSVDPNHPASIIAHRARLALDVLRPKP